MNSLEERLSWLEETVEIEKKQVKLYEVQESKVLIEEDSKEGVAKLTCKLSNYCVCICNLDKKKLDKYFKIKKGTDGIIFEKLPNDEWILHIIELKKTINSEKWELTKEQFQGAYINANAWMGILGIQHKIKEVRCYTAYRNDSLSAKETDTALIKFGSESDVLLKKPTVDWRQDEIQLPVIHSKKIKHRKIQLNYDSGEGVVNL